MIDPAILRAMQAAGASTDVIIAAVEAAAALDNAKADERRAKDAERQRRHRASRGVTVTERDSVTDPSLSRPPNENNSNPPTHTHPDVNIPRARKAGVFPMLDCTDEATWADFLTNRSKKRLPNTASAHRKLETDLAAMVARTGWPPGKVFAACVAKGWGAIYDPRDEENGRTGFSAANDSRGIRGSRPDPALDMLYQAQRELQAEAERENQGFGQPTRLALPPH